MRRRKASSTILISPKHTSQSPSGRWQRSSPRAGSRMCKRVHGFLMESGCAKFSRTQRAATGKESGRDSDTTRWFAARLKQQDLTA